MTIKTPEGTHLTAAPEIIVTVMKQAHMTACDMTNPDYMEHVRQDTWRLHGIQINTASCEAFLRSLADNNLITIEEAA